MKVIFYFTVILSLLPVAMHSSEKVHEQQMKEEKQETQKEQILFDFNKVDDDFLIATILSVSDIFNVRHTDTRMHRLAEEEFAKRIDARTITTKDLLKLKHVATSQLLKKSVEAEYYRRGREQNEQFKQLLVGTELDLSKKSIDYIYPGAFDQLAQVENLNLARNNVKTLDSRVFKGLVNLRIFVLDDNKIEKLDSEIFKGLTKLQYVWLSGNLFEKLDPGIFNHLGNLKDICLSNNPLDLYNVEKLKNALPGVRIEF